MKDDLPDIIKEVGFDFDWDSKKVWRLELPVVEMDIEELLWHFDIPFWEKDGTDTYNLTPWEVIRGEVGIKEHRERVTAVDLRYPLDIMKNKGRWLLLDGLHRLVKAYGAGHKRVRVRKIPREKMPEILRTKA